MKRRLYFAGISALLLIFTAAGQASAQKVGGYKKIARSDAGAASAAAFAIRAQAEKTKATIELVSVENAESQVVAGTNYRLCLKVTTSGEENEADVTITVKVVVYRNLKAQYSLTSWTEEDCAGDEDA
jgi:cystatin-C